MAEVPGGGGGADKAGPKKASEEATTKWPKSWVRLKIQPQLRSLQTVSVTMMTLANRKGRLPAMTPMKRKR